MVAVGEYLIYKVVLIKVKHCCPYLLEVTELTLPRCSLILVSEALLKKVNIKIRFTQILV